MVLEPAAACAFRHWTWQLAPCLHNGALAYQSRLIVDPNDSNSPLQLIRIRSYTWGQAIASSYDDDDHGIECSDPAQSFEYVHGSF